MTFGVIVVYPYGQSSLMGSELVDVAQLVEHLVVIQDVAGSSPVVHPFQQLTSDPIGSLVLLGICKKNPTH